MATYRNVRLSFWTDPDVTDEFTPEDRYFYLYLLTNPHTNLCGCYEISIRQMVNEVGYSKESIENLIIRFERVHKVICYSPETKEILLINWHKYNWTTSEKFRKPLKTEIDTIKDTSFKEYLSSIFNGDTVSIPYRYGSDTTVTVTDTVTDTVTVSSNNNNSNYLNNRDKDKQQEADALFETLWSMYPKKRGKGSVTSKQKRRLLEIGFDAMSRCVDRYVTEMKGKSEQFIKNGSTFFNSGYVDYLDENYAPIQSKTDRDAQLFRNVANEYMMGGDVIDV